MLPLGEMLSELGKVTIRYWEGTYQADDGHVSAGGHTPEGAVWNLLHSKRDAVAKGVAPGIFVRTHGRMVAGVEVGDIPTAGQDSY